MWVLTLFSLRRRFFNKMTIILNMILFLALGFLVHADYLVEQKEEIKVIYLDDSTAAVKDSITNNSGLPYRYVESNQHYDDDSAILHYEGSWKLYSKHAISEEMKKSIISDLNETLLTGINRRRLVNDLENISEEKENPVWLAITVIYFLLLSYSSLLANEVIYEKATNTLTLILSAVNAGKHLIHKILCGYLSMLIQGFILFVMGVFWGTVRYGEDRFKGLGNWLENSGLINFNDTALQTGRNELIVAALLVLAGIMSVQLSMLVISSSFENSEDAGSFQSIFYLLMVVVYYLLVIYGDEDFFLSSTSRILSFVPIFSLLFMPCRLIISSATIMEGIVSLVISLFSFVVTGGMLIPVYRRNLLKEKALRPGVSLNR